MTEPFLQALSRRDLLRRGSFAAGGLVLAGGLLAACGSDDDGSSSDASGSSTTSGKLDRTVVLGWGGAACEAPLFSAFHNGYFEDEGVDAKLVKFDGATLHDSVSSGKIDGSPGILFEWLKPIEQGLNIKLVGGLHKGCLRFVAKKDSGLTQLSDLKGKTIATDTIGGSAMAFFSVDLAKAGINPAKDVQWKSFKPDQLGNALEKGEADAVAAPDPFAFTLTENGGPAVEIASNLTPEHRNQFCCTVALNGDLVKDHPETAAAVTRAWFKGAQWVGKNIPASAQLEIDNKYVPAPAPLIESLLAQYIWDPGTVEFQEQLIQGAKDFKSTGYLDSSTDPNILATNAFVDVLNA